MININNDWKFVLGDVKNAHSVGFNDRTWKCVDLPHDWVISAPFSKGTSEGWTPQNMQGFFAWQGICWYRKVFSLPVIDEKLVYIYFGGAYRNSTIYVNGKEAAKRANGYISFEVDITNLVKEGENTLAVRLDNGCEEPDRWYSGSGLYRNVFLKVVPITHIKTWGIQVKTELAKNLKQADINISTTIVSKKQGKKGIVWVRLIGPNGNFVAESTVPFNCAASGEITVNQTLRVQNPALWSSEKPDLYRAAIQLEVDGKKGNPEEINIGIRSIKIAYNKGMTVNGQKVKLKGVCLHHECGITGSAHYDSVWQRRLSILKSIGCNAIRTSHNPPAQEFLDICDKMGFYVIDECFDKWKSGYYAKHFDSDAQRDLTDFILRDRNHPSIFMWSVGNEVENQGTDSMIAIQKKLTDIVRSLDNRPVTCALSPHANPRSLVGSPPAELVKLTKKMAKDVDVLGFNYHEPLYPYYTKGIEKPIIGTECYEYYSSVGTNFEDVCDKNPWQYVLESENVIGQFIWAGIDYLGECPWPAKGWSGSIIDICGFLKPNAYFRKSIWTDEPMIYLAFNDQGIKNDYARGRWSFPPVSSHLNHDHFSRRNVTAVIYTNCEEAQLWVNGKLRGNRLKEDFSNGVIEWPMEYTTGSIEVKGFKNGKEVCSHILKTASLPQKIKLISDKQELKPSEIAHIEINITDKAGLLYPNDEFLIEFALEGDAHFIGASSPDLNQNLGYTIPKVVTSGGKALVIIKAGDNAGVIDINAYSEKLEKTSLRLKVR